MSEQRLCDIESAIANHEKTIEELSDVVFEQGKKIDELIKINKYLLNQINKDVVKPLEEETPPPHY